MFKTLFIKEIMENFVSRRFLIVLFLSLILIPLGTYIGARDYKIRLNSYQESLELYQRDHKTNRDVLSKGAKGFRPPSPFGFLSEGLEVVLPNIAETPTIFQRAPVDIRLNNNQSYGNLYASFFGPLDLAFIVSAIMTFLAIIFSFGAISAEKEQGTLKLILANPVPRYKLILAKITANFLLLIGAFYSAEIMSVLVLFTVGSSFVGLKDILIRTALAMFFSTLLITAFLNLGLMVSALTRRAVSSFIILLLCWVFLFSIYPRLSTLISQVIYPIKSEQLVLLEKTQIRRENEKVLMASINKIIESGNDIEGKQDAAFLEYRAKVTERWQKLDQEQEYRRNNQTQIAINLSRLSPVSCFVLPLADISQTGLMRHQQFMQDVGGFRSALNDQIYGKYQIYYQKSGVSSDFKGDEKALAPTFHTTWTRTEDIIRNILPDAVLLILFNIIFISAAFVAFLKYDVR